MSTPRPARTLELINTSAGEGSALLPPDAAQLIGSNNVETEISTPDASNPGVIGELDASSRLPAALGEIGGDLLVRFRWGITDEADAGTTARVNAALFLDGDPDNEVARVEGVERAADSVQIHPTERYAQGLDFPAGVRLDAGRRITLRLEVEVVVANGGSLAVTLHHDPESGDGVDRALVHLSFGELETV